MTKIIFEKSNKGQKGITLCDSVHLEYNIDSTFLREKSPILPEITELEVMRHFKELSDKNFCIESGLYPLGSCTMKYNPKISEVLSNLKEFSNLHPLIDDKFAQGSLEIMFNLQNQLKEITGMDHFTLEPSAGAHGELCGMMIVKKYFDVMNQKERKKVIVPDSAHGTNPASAAMCNFEIIQVKSNEKGQVDLNDLDSLLDNTVAAIMMTNPNTLGIFEENIDKISKKAHDVGALMYYDGANFNAIMGQTNPKIMGFDIVHLNLHKTFATPHGGGGPGSGPVGVVEKLKDFLPVPIIKFNGSSYYRDYNVPCSIGKVKSFFGNFAVLLKAYIYILMMGKNLKRVSEDAVLNANYIKSALKPYYLLPYDVDSLHEFVLSGDIQKSYGVNTFKIAKKLIDMKFHPPTIYFPLIVHEAIMIEPTETETKQRLDEFIEAMINIAIKAKDSIDEFCNIPANAPVKLVDETYAARHLDLKFKI